MAIQLRTNKASALTYNEMDRNFSSFFYSASIDNGNILKLWYTGSSTLNTAQDDDFGPARFIPIDLQPTTGAVPTLTVAGDPRAIQFRHSTNPILDADNGFIYNTALQLGIGVSLPAANAKIHARGTNTVPATLRLESTTNNGTNRRATVDFYQGVTSMGSIGRDTHNDNNLYIKTYIPSSRYSGPRGLLLEEIINEDAGHIRFTIGTGDPRIGGNFGAFTQVGFGIGTLLPQHALQVQGNGYITGKLGVGDVPNTAALNVFQTAQTGTSLGDFETIAQFGIATGTSNVDTLRIISLRELAGNADYQGAGMRIQQKVDSTYHGYIQFSGEGNTHGFSIGTGYSTNPHKPGHPDIGERLRITPAGRVGINTINPERILDVAGDTIVRGIFTSSLHVDVGLSLKTGTSVAVGTNLTVGGTATIQTIAAGTAGTTSALVATSTGLVQKIDAAPIPKGGIILWSGTHNNIPAGWCLCNGQTINGIVTPNLVDRFVVGAQSAYAAQPTTSITGVSTTTGGTKDAVVVEHSHSVFANQNWNQGINELLGANPPGDNTKSAKVAGDHAGGSWNYAIEASTLAATIGKSSTVGTSGNNQNLPPYYALAYIMYGGQV